MVHLGVGGLLSDEAKESVMMDKSLPMAMCTLVQHWVGSDAPVAAETVPG